jgi:hypothetical protein
MYYIGFQPSRQEIIPEKKIFQVWHVFCRAGAFFSKFCAIKKFLSKRIFRFLPRQPGLDLD